ncbi:minor capsid protein [Clostridium sp. LY3-2]|uniref:minor capsid protein n=1 Tax=Clostridium sp. LY3-2 TaxID=2942482 RepID=UPI00215245DE|nr:minor capsid protein [Clostridium sp. LY3-2]MCR6516316.1 minor capsid protein [Clostridium sp. LY3-2]
MHDEINIKGFSKLDENQKFYVKNFIKLVSELHKKGDSIISELDNFQGQNEDELLKHIATIMLKFNIKEESIELTNAQQKEIKKYLFKVIDDAFIDEYNKEKANVSKQLKENIIDQYNINNFLLSFGLDFNLKKISDFDLDRILNEKIKGENYSDRIWNNKNEVAQKVKVIIKKFLNGEISCNKIEKEIRERYKVNKSISSRLIRNEITRVQTESNEQFFKDNDGEYLLYSATLDLHTCDKCKSYDGKVYRVDEERPQLPLHVNDRCMYILLPNKDFRPSNRLDNITKKNVSYKDYIQWYEEKEKQLGKDSLKAEELRIKNKGIDRSQFNNYKNVLGSKNLPKSLKGFQKLKYNNIDEWNLLKDYKRSRSSNMISAFTSFDDYKEFKRRIEKELVGLTTSNGIEIKSQSKHFIERVIGTSFDPEKKKPRDGVDLSVIEETLKRPLKVKEEPKKNSHKFISDRVTVTINPYTGNLIQCNPTDADLVRRLKNV